MNSQQEYEMFMLKIAKAVHEMRDDFSKLSPENKQRFAQAANAFLSIEITLFGIVILVKPLHS